MLVKWETSKYLPGVITEVKAVQESAKSVWVEKPEHILGPNGWQSKIVVKKRPRLGEYEQYHDSWEVAKAFLVKASDEAVETLREDYEFAVDLNRKIHALQPPSALQSMQEPEDGVVPFD